MHSHPLRVTFSVVVYNSPYEEVERVVKSLLLYKEEKTIYVVDNSPTVSLPFICQLDACIRYKHFPSNIGFGAAHNWALERAHEEGSSYHFIVNPDVYYDQDVAAPMVEYLEAHPMIGEMMPRILSPDGTKQYLPKLMPTPLMLLQRQADRLFHGRCQQWMERFEMRSMRDDRVYEIGHVSGCFAVLRMEAYEKCGGFDKRFFLYFDDTDLSRRVHQHYVTAYYPMAYVYHKYGHAASKSTKHFMLFLVSLIKYFNKWGWLFDKERKRSNRLFLSQL